MSQKSSAISLCPITGTRYQHDSIVGVHLDYLAEAALVRSLHYKVFSPFPCALLEGNYSAQFMLTEWKLSIASLRVEYLYKLRGILLHGIFVLSLDLFSCSIIIYIRRDSCIFILYIKFVTQY